MCTERSQVLTDGQIQIDGTDVPEPCNLPRLMSFVVATVLAYFVFRHHERDEIKSNSIPEC